MAAYMPASFKRSEFSTHGESAYGQVPFSFPIAKCPSKK